MRRRALHLVALWLLAAAAAWAGDARVAAVGAVGLTVSDLGRSVAFYRDVLGFTPEDAVEVRGAGWERLRGVDGLDVRVARLRLGRERLELAEYVAPRGRPAPAGARSNDRWFQHVAIVVRDIDRAWARLRAHRVARISSAPQRLPDWNPNAGGIRAVYFRDPDGHPLELIWFPPGRGDPRWRAPSEALFLGIDHTAIAVGDTGASLAFYRDRLGLRVAGESENWGPEQERLAAVPGAHLRITGLRAADGPGVELLEYLAPRDGRPFPADERANDLVHWQIRLVARDGALDALGAAVVLPGRELGFGRGTTVRDPDGHTLEIVEP